MGKSWEMGAGSTDLQQQAKQSPFCENLYSSRKRQTIKEIKQETKKKKPDKQNRISRDDKVP